MTKIVLATESRYKKALFSRLNLDFTSVAADIDESPIPGETADLLAARLAKGKAQAIADSGNFNNHWIVGADQSAQSRDQLVFKPGSHNQAVKDLSRYSGQTLDFYTAVYTISPSGRHRSFMDLTSVHFRDLSQKEIEGYLEKEKPYDCAGAFKAEGLGVSLFESIESTDPTAIVGLPLIQLSHYLRSEGFNCYES